MAETELDLSQAEIDRAHTEANRLNKAFDTYKEGLETQFREHNMDLSKDVSLTQHPRAYLAKLALKEEVTNDDESETLADVAKNAALSEAINAELADDEQLLHEVKTHNFETAKMMKQLPIWAREEKIHEMAKRQNMTREAAEKEIARIRRFHESVAKGKRQLSENLATASKNTTE